MDIKDLTPGSQINAISRPIPQQDIKSEYSDNNKITPLDLKKAKESLNSPLVVPSSQYPELRDINKDSSLATVINDDAAQYTHILRELGKQWNEATDVDVICRLALTTSKMIESRRKALLFPFEAERNKVPQDNYLMPFDD